VAEAREAAARHRRGLEKARVAKELRRKERHCAREEQQWLQREAPMLARGPHEREPPRVRVRLVAEPTGVRVLLLLRVVAGRRLGRGECGWVIGCVFALQLGVGLCAQAITMFDSNLSHQY